VGPTDTHRLESICGSARIAKVFSDYSSRIKAGKHVSWNGAVHTSFLRRFVDIFACMGGVSFVHWVAALPGAGYYRLRGRLSRRGYHALNLHVNLARMNAEFFRQIRVRSLDSNLNEKYLGRI